LRIPSVIAILACTASASALAADDKCSWFRLAGESGADFLSADKCGKTQTEYGALRYCYWEFPYRSVGATAKFDHEQMRVAACISDATDPHTPTGVNHPDTHKVRIFITKLGKITVSLKDKAQHGKTLVFLQIEPENVQ